MPARSLPALRALSLGAALVLARPALAASDGITVPLSTEGCPGARLGAPLVPFRDDVLVGVVGDGCNYVSLRDGRTGRERRRYTSPIQGAIGSSGGFGFAEAIAALRGLVLVGAPAEPAVHALDAQSGRLVRTYAPPDTVSREGDFGTAILGLGSRVIVGARFDGVEVDEPRPYGTVHVFDAATGRLERSIPPPESPSARGFGVRLAALPRRRIAVGTIDAAAGRMGRVFVVDVRTGGVVTAITTAVPEGDFSGAFTTAGSRIIVGVPQASGAPPGGIVQIYDATDGHLVRTLTSPGGASEAFGANVAARGRELLVVAPPASLAPDQGATVYLFDLRMGRLTGRSDVSTAPVMLPTFLRRGFAYAVASGLGGPLELVYRYRLPPPP